MFYCKCKQIYYTFNVISCQWRAFDICERRPSKWALGPAGRRPAPAKGLAPLGFPHRSSVGGERSVRGTPATPPKTKPSRAWTGGPAGFCPAPAKGLAPLGFPHHDHWRKKESLQDKAFPGFNQWPGKAPPRNTLLPAKNSGLWGLESVAPKARRPTAAAPGVKRPALAKLASAGARRDTRHRPARRGTLRSSRIARTSPPTGIRSGGRRPGAAPRQPGRRGAPGAALRSIPPPCAPAPRRRGARSTGIADKIRGRAAGTRQAMVSSTTEQAGRFSVMKSSSTMKSVNGFTARGLSSKSL